MEPGGASLVREEIVAARNSYSSTLLNKRKAIKHELGKVLSRSQSTGDIPMMCFTDGAERQGSEESNLKEANRWFMRDSAESLSDILGDNAKEDSFQREVVNKTQAYMVGRLEAEREVLIDMLITKEGNKDMALLHVVSQMTVEQKVQIFVNTLLQRGANPSVSDSNWQTPLHHAVKKGFKGVVSELLENDALPHARDKDKKYPFHLAVENSQDEIGSLLLKYMPNNLVRELFITHSREAAECSFHDLLKRDMQKTALAVMDCMVDKVGETSHMKIYYHILEADEKGRPPPHPNFENNSKSCLHLISKEGHKELISHLVVRLLIRRKWKEYARFRFQLNLIMFLVTHLCLTFSVVTAVMTPDPTLYDASLQTARAVFEVWSLLAVILTCINESNQIRKHKLDYWRDPFNWIDLGSTSLLLIVVPLRFTHCQEQWYVYSVGYLLWTLRIFKYAAVLRQTGAYAQILWRIVSNDFLQFTILFLVILLSFSGSFILALRGDESLGVHEETSSFWNVLFTGVRILIEGQPVVEYAGADGYRPLSCILMVVFLFVSCVVLLNILIAQLSDTYQNVQKDAQRGLEMNRAWIIMRVELNSLFIGKGSNNIIRKKTKLTMQDSLLGKLLLKFPYNLEIENVCKTETGTNSRLYKRIWNPNSICFTVISTMEELNNPVNLLEKWEFPLLNEISSDVRSMKNYLESTEMSMMTIKNRLSRQEYTLKCLQEQLEMLVQKLSITETRNSA